MSEIEKSILQKVKDKLKINYEIDSINLYHLLNKKRILSHPDKFQNAELKRQATEDFKELNSLLSELHTFIKSENLKKGSEELIIYEKEYELIDKNQFIIDLEEKIKNLNNELDLKSSEIKSLKEALDNLKVKDLNEKTKELIELYKPTSKNLFSLGISIVIAIILGVISKIDNVASIIKKYFPFSLNIFNIIVFTILSLIIINYIHKIFEGKLIEKLTKKIKTQSFINKFVIFLENKNKSEHFTEHNVIEFFEMEIAPQNHLSKFFFSNFFSVKNDVAINSMKDIFIYNLLNRKLISISSAQKLDRKFKIINNSYYFFDYDLPF